MSTELRKRPKPVLVTESHLKQMDWQDSIDRCEDLKRKEKAHGHELAYKCGDEVIDFQGNVGVLTHKEFLYADTPSGPGHDVWQLVVLQKATLKTYSNPAALSLHCMREDVQHGDLKPANLRL